MSRPCTYCEGAGCSECDDTGRRYSEGFDVDGITVMASGSGDGLTPEDREAIAAVAKAAIAVTRCPRDSDWCDGEICAAVGFPDCPNSDAARAAALQGEGQR